MEVSKLREEFLNKLQKEEYISNYLFENIKNTIPDIIPVNFNLDNYNNKVLDKEYIKYKEYFDTMYNDIDPEIHLDEEQIKAILSDEEYSLILAGAGTGKTTVIRAILENIDRVHGVGTSFLLLAPTGKAAERIKTQTGKNSSTKHSHLAKCGWINKNFTLKRSGGATSEDVNTIIIDECSMIDLNLFATLMRSINWNSVQRLILSFHLLEEEEYSQMQLNG